MGGSTVVPPFHPRIKLHQKLLEAQEKVVGYLTGRKQVHSKLGDWFT